MLRMFNCKGFKCEPLSVGVGIHGLTSFGREECGLGILEARGPV